MIGKKELPSGWVIKTLRQISVGNKGEYGSNSAAIEYAIDKPRYIRITDVDEYGKLNPKKVSPGKENDWDQYRLEVGQILFARSGATVGKTYLHQDMDCWGVFAGYFIRFIPDKNQINSKYLFYYTKSEDYRNWVESKQKVVAQPNINEKQFGDELYIPLTSLETQKKIVDVLDKAQNLIDKRKEQIKKLDEFLQSVFFYMLGDPINNEMGWQKQKIREVSQVKIGPFGSLLHAEDYIQDGIPLVNPSHIVQGKICPAVKFTISKEKAEELSQYRMVTGNIVLGRRGEIGRCALVTAEHDGFLCGTGSLFISPSSNLNPVFLVHAISSAPVRKVLENAAQGITMKNLNSTIIESLEIGIPPIDIQNQFAQIVEKTEQQKELMQQSLIEMENNFNSLMQRAFGGELF